MFIKQIAKFLTVVAVLLFGFFITMGIPSYLYAQSTVNLTMRIGDTSLTLSGYTAPNSQISVMENNVVLGTTSSNSFGEFSKTLLAVEPGIHTFQLYSVDEHGDATVTVSYNISVLQHVDSEISNIVLAPTLFVRIDNNTLVANGTSVPSATVRIYLDDKVIRDTSVDSIGNWATRLDASYFHDSAKTITVKALVGELLSESSIGKDIQLSQTFNGGSGSPTYEDENFIISDAPSQSNSSEDSDERFIPNLISRLTSIFDLNNDARIDLSEISDLIRSWMQSWTSSDIANCDFNSDSACDLTDFSILLHFLD